MESWIGQTGQSSTGARRSVFSEEPTNLKPYQATADEEEAGEHVGQPVHVGPHAAGTQP